MQTRPSQTRGAPASPHLPWESNLGKQREVGGRGEASEDRQSRNDRHVFIVLGNT